MGTLFLTTYLPVFREPIETQQIRCCARGSRPLPCFFPAFPVSEPSLSAHLGSISRLCVSHEALPDSPEPEIILPPIESPQDSLCTSLETAREILCCLFCCLFFHTKPREGRETGSELGAACGHQRVSDHTRSC